MYLSVLPYQLVVANWRWEPSSIKPHLARILAWFHHKRIGDWSVLLKSQRPEAGLVSQEFSSFVPLAEMDVPGTCQIVFSLAESFFYLQFGDRKSIGHPVVPGFVNSLNFLIGSSRIVRLFHANISVDDIGCFNCNHNISVIVARRRLAPKHFFFVHPISGHLYSDSRAMAHSLGSDEISRLVDGWSNAGDCCS